MNHDYLFKYVIVGDICVGKTSLLVRYTDNSFSINYKNTIGCDFKTKTVEVNNTRIVLQMWDTSGQERFKALSSSFYRNADVLVIVYDVTNMKSFQTVPKWLEDAEYYSGNNPIKECLLIGNKTDKTERVVDYDLAKRCADNFHMDYIETSAKENTNVAQAFDTMTMNVLENHGYDGVFEARGSSRGGTIRLDQNGKDISSYSGYCCEYF